MLSATVDLCLQIVTNQGYAVQTGRHVRHQIRRFGIVLSPLHEMKSERQITSHCRLLCHF